MRKPEDFEVCSVLARKGVKASRQRTTKAPSYVGCPCQFLLLASAQQNIWCNGSQSWLLISIIRELLKVLLPRPRHLTSDLMLTCRPCKTRVNITSQRHHACRLPFGVPVTPQRWTRLQNLPSATSSVASLC